MTASTITRHVLAALLLTQLMACGGSGSDPEEVVNAGEPIGPINVGGDGDIFDPARLLNIEITLSPSDYNTLRQEGRSLAETSRQCAPAFEYTDFAGSVTIDGATMHNVSIRKKGFLGSLSSVRPSFKFDFDQFQDDRTYQNETRMTLNNNRQDASNLHQCLVYDLYRTAGLPAPRCNFARVSVNGQDLGIYTNVEDIKKPFLKREFGNSNGNLYEAQLADFGTHLSDRFEKKTNEEENDRSDLATVTAAMALPDEEFVTVMPNLINLDQFIRFWALETLSGNWDSATGNANNFLIYRSPADNLFYFIPWGTDEAFTGRHLLSPGGGPLYRNFRLAQRLYDIEAYRAQYFAAINDYLETLWDETALAEKIAAMQTLTETADSAVRDLLTFIQGNESIRSQRTRLLSAISGLEPEQVVTTLADTEPDCIAPFSTNLSLVATSLNNVNSGIFSFNLPAGGAVSGYVDLSSADIDSITAEYNTRVNPAMRTFIITGVDLNHALKPYAVAVLLEEPNIRPGSLPFHGFSNTVMVYAVDAENPSPETSTLIALGNRGTITISSVGPRDDDISIQLNGTLEFVAD